jgi:hypothetical protein
MLLRDGFAFKLLAYFAIRWSLAADCTYHGTHDAVRASIAGGLYYVQVRARIGSATALPGSTREHGFRELQKLVMQNNLDCEPKVEVDVQHC